MIDSSIRLVYYFSDLYQITFVVLFMGCTGAICLTTLMVQIDIVSVILLIW